MAKKCPPQQPPDEEMKLETAPFDPRFPNQNQTRYCYQSYLDYHRCVEKRGEEYTPCNYFSKIYKIMCPNEWVATWDEQRIKGNFPGRIQVDRKNDKFQ